MNNFFRLLLILCLSLFSISAIAADDIEAKPAGGDFFSNPGIPPSTPRPAEGTGNVDTSGTTEVTDTCDISDTSESQCAVCNCYMHTSDMLVSTYGQRYPGGEDALLQNLELLAKTIQVPQARVGNTKFPNNMCQVVYQPKQFSQIGFPNRFYQSANSPIKGPPRQLVEPLDGEYKRRMLSEKIITACKAAYEYAQTNENPGHLFWMDTFSFRRSGVPTWARRSGCRPSGEILNSPILTMSCPRLEAEGSRDRDVAAEQQRFKKFQEN